MEEAAHCYAASPVRPEFIASYNEAVARKVVPPKGTLLSVLRAYQESSEFRERAQRTRSDYVAKIKLIEGDVRRFPADRTDRQAHSRRIQGMARTAGHIIAPAS